MTQIITDSRAPIYDRQHGGLVVLDELHHMTHRGLLFNVSKHFTGVANNGFANILLRASVDKTLHVVFSSTCGGNSLLNILEDPTTSGGASLSIINRNRGAVNNVNAVALSNVTISDPGLLLEEKFIPGGSGRPAAGGTATSFASEYIFLPNIDYVIRVQNISGQSREVGISIVFYTGDEV